MPTYRVRLARRCRVDYEHTLEIEAAGDAAAAAAARELCYSAGNYYWEEVDSETDYVEVADVDRLDPEPVDSPDPRTGRGADRRRGP